MDFTLTGGARYLANGSLRLTDDGKMRLPRGPAVPHPALFRPPEGFTLSKRGDPTESGVMTFTYTGTVSGADVTIERELFLSMWDTRLICQRLTFTADRDCRLGFCAGVDPGGQDGCRLRGDETALCLEQDLDNGSVAAAAARFPFPVRDDRGDGSAACFIDLKAGEPMYLDMAGAVVTGPKSSDPARAALELTRRVPGWDWHLKTHQRLYGDLFGRTRVSVKNAPEIGRALDIARYRLICLAPGDDQNGITPGADAFDPGKEDYFLSGDGFPAMTFYLLNLPRAAERILGYWTKSALDAGESAPLDKAAAISGELTRCALITGDTSLIRGGGAELIGKTAGRIFARYADASASPFPRAGAVLTAAADLNSRYGTCPEDLESAYRALAASWGKDPEPRISADTPEDEAGKLYDDLVTRILGLTVSEDGPDFSGEVPPGWGEVNLPLTVRGRTYRARLT